MKHFKDKQELRRQFLNSVYFVKESIKSALSKDCCDPLREEYAKSIAVKLRVLLIDGKRNKSLSSLLGISTKVLFSTICAFSSDLPGNLIHSFSLANEHTENGRCYFISNYSKNRTELRCTLSCWLDEVVFDRKQSAVHKVSRKDIILALADKEGGAHVDPSFEEEYYAILYGAGYYFFPDKEKAIKADNNLFSEALLTIAQEFVEAVDEYFTYLMGASFHSCENDLSLVELLYEEKDTGIIRKKFIHNQGRDILRCFLFSYDYLNTARYRLLFSKNYLFEKGDKRFLLRVIDDTNYWDALFCVSAFDTFVFIKNNEKYSRVTSDNDLYNLGKLSNYTFSQAVRLMRSDKLSNIDCLSKQKIYLEHSK